MHRNQAPLLGSTAFASAALALFLVAMPGIGQAQTVGDDLNAAGQSIKQGAQDTGQTIGEGAHETGQAIGEGAREAGTAVKEGAKKAGQEIKEGAQATGEFAEDKTREARSGIGGFFHRIGNWFSGESD